ncbi:branched-chain amino acid transport system permease protein [Rhodococcus sp. PvR044]|jgi:branched-chain amino acid transport system permease protein|uniref:branched-chain amino acid ABC transporter permease n=1 Tax=Rhodococcus TaxID=1827 RepID=UPI000BD4A2DF|nr:MULTISPECIES: branched-chain amino acid ABC transporter permease [Rhodococcus]MBP1159093.1 branched-chain amino acid transport system permease protein [Rhodococcus sp. PvR099]MCZ4558557.1 branched-chain amino acid ABC transporter permease [Rhodococcus maanshanensis]PTR39034.1 amino acid/amide ABC transporter membrane protein 1 (HAAT family) [Rhodococcus sp. OK611]SNX92820.1 amino acid/amide ABC transporter membrane protein 1, HAAT family [Rhodococcus sp. OK270]
MIATSLAASATLYAGNIDFNIEGLTTSFWQLTIDGLSYGAIYALVAIGYTLVYGVLRLINFAHSEVFMLGMFGQYVALELLGFTPSGNAYNEGVVMTVVFLGLAMLFGMAVSGGAAVGLERVAYRPLRKRGAKPLTFLITAIGMSFVLQEFVHYVLPEIWPGLGGTNAQQPIKLVQPVEVFSIFGASVSNVTIVIIVAALLLTLVTDMIINRTKFGRGIRAVAQDPDTATLMGISRERVIMLTFLLGGILAGAAALLYTLKIPSGIIFNGGFILGIKAFSAAVLGGIGNLRGALLGGLLLGVMENYGQVLFGTEWRDVVAFVLLVVVLMFRPTGILGESLGRARV